MRAEPASATQGPVALDLERASDLPALLEEQRLLSPDEHGIVRLPVLLGGSLLAPADVQPDEVLDSVAERSTAEVGSVVVVREPLLDRSRMVVSGQRYLVMPRVEDPNSLIVDRPEEAGAELRSLPLFELASQLDRVGALLEPGAVLHERLRELLTGGLQMPDRYVDIAMADVRGAIDGSALRAAIDWELGAPGVPGGDFLDGWVKVAGQGRPGAAARLSAEAHGAAPLPARDAAMVRAMPTRQLHITAGNSPVVPVISTLRALVTKGMATVKLPSGAIAAGAALALALKAAGPDHPLAANQSIVYWRGGDERIEAPLLAEGAFDRIVVWGAPGAVDAVRSRARAPKTVVFNPRYGLSLIGREASQGRLREAARRGATDSLVWEQQACISSLVHYVEGDDRDADRYAELLREELARWDDVHPRPLGREALSRIRSARRGGMIAGRWAVNRDGEAMRSAVVSMPSAFDLSSHPAARVIAVRRVDDLEQVVSIVGPQVSNVGVFPPQRIDGLADPLASRGVSCVLPLGETDTSFAGMPHDGMRALGELVSWAVR